MAETAKARKGLKILTLDGGGMQGLSTLMILNDLMDAIAANDRNTKGKPRPCDIFDIIGGIGVGGWLALLLGRFHFDVPTCIKVYIRIVEAISPIKSWQKLRLMLSNGANFDQCKLIEEINLLAEKYKTGKMMIFQNAKGPRCQHAFAAAAEKRRTGQKTQYQIFRTYRTAQDAEARPGPDPSDCTIADAFASTSAAKYIFESFSVSNVKFSDNGFPDPHNITDLAIDEAQSICGKHHPMSVVVNVGPGIPTQGDVWKLGGLAKVFSFGTPDSGRGMPLFETTAHRRAAPERDQEFRNLQTGNHSSKLLSPDTRAMSPKNRKPRKPMSQALIRELEIESAIKARLAKEYPPATDLVGNERFLYFRLGPSEAPKTTAVNDVFAADIVYKATEEYLQEEIESLNPIFNSAISCGQIPGAVLAASSADGRFNYLKAFGQTSCDPDSPPLATDATLCLFSATKLFTAVAALQCVDRGLVSLDEDVSRILPELKEPNVLKGWEEEDRPVLEKAKTSISLRHLLSHTSGLTYDFSAPGLQKYLKSVGEDVEFSVLLKSYLMGKLNVRPLLFEPGEGWAYGIGLDWAGLMVERLSGAASLGAYMQEHIWIPLGMTSSTFRLSEHPDIAARLPQMVARSPTGSLTNSNAFADPMKSATKDMGGGRMYSSAGDYIKLLSVLLRNDDTLLSKSSVSELLKPRVRDNAHLDHERNAYIFSNIWPNGVKVTCKHSLGGLVSMEDLSTGRKTGSVMWLGVTAIGWWLDSESQVCGFFGSQIMPGAPHVINLNGEFEKAVYQTWKHLS